MGQDSYAFIECPNQILEGVLVLGIHVERIVCYSLILLLVIFCLSLVDRTVQMKRIYYLVHLSIPCIPTQARIAILGNCFLNHISASNVIFVLFICLFILLYFILLIM